MKGNHKNRIFQHRTMNCKNCDTPLNENAKFCSECGGKIIVDRLTFKMLITDALVRAFGWDSKFFTTVRFMFWKPEVILSAYINGVRKRYVNPIAFFAIGMTISLIIFNIFQEHYLEISGITEVTVSDTVQSSEAPVAVQFSPGELTPEQLEEIQLQMEIAAMVQRTILKYFNVYSFALLPIYTLIAFLVYGRKRNNYTEQLVINAYIQGFLFLVTILSFILSLFILRDLYMYSMIVTVGYYTYAYARFYKLNWKKAIVLFLKFLLILAVFMIVGVVIMVGLGILFAMLFR